MQRVLISLALIAATNIDSAVKVIPIPSSPYNNSSSVSIVESKERALSRSDSLYLKIQSFPLGVSTTFEGMEDAGVRELSQGSEILVIYAGKYNFYVTLNDVQNFQQKRAYFTRHAKIKIPSKIVRKAEVGEVPIIAVPINCYGESIKSKSAIGTAILVHKEVKHRGENIALALREDPLLFYNMPEDNMVFSRHETILLDYVLLNTHLSEHGNYVELLIDGRSFELTKWAPYGIMGLEPGKHKIEIRLKDKQGRILANPFGLQKATIQIKP